MLKGREAKQNAWIFFFHFLNVFWAKMFFCLSKYQAKRDGNDNSGQIHTSINFMVIDLEYFARKKNRNFYEEKKTYLMGENYVPLIYV